MNGCSHGICKGQVLSLRFWLWCRAITLIILADQMMRARVTGMELWLDGPVRQQESDGRC